LSSRHRFGWEPMTLSDLQAAAPNNLRRTAFLACLSPGALSRISLLAETFGTLFASFCLSLSPLTSLLAETFGTLFAFAFAGSFSLLAVLFLGLVAGPFRAAPIHTTITCQRHVTITTLPNLFLLTPLSSLDGDLPKQNVSHNNDGMEPMMWLVLTPWPLFL
jgi:hypothetical protein